MAASSSPLPSAVPAPSWSAILALSLAYFLSTGWNLWVQQIENPDEPRYTAPARMMARGESGWLVPMFNGSKRTVKPILIYWSLAAAGKTGEALGFSRMDTPMRVVPLLAGWLAVLAVYGLGARLFNARVGLLSGLILLTTFYFHDEAREILTDPMLTGFLTAAWCCFAIAIQSLERDKQRTPYFPLLGFYVSLGLACLTKGPVLVAVFAVLPIVAYLVWERRRYLPESGRMVWLLHRTGLWWGLPLALGLGFYWHAMLWSAGYEDDVKRFFFEQNLQRAAGQLDKNKDLRIYPWIWYFQDLPGHFVPWAILFPVAIAWSWKHRAGMCAPAKLLLCALAIPFFAMGLAGSKRSLYLLPLYPLFALWMALVWDRLLSEANSGLRSIWKGLLITIAVVATLAAVALTVAGPMHLIRRLPPFTDTETVLVAVMAAVLVAGAVLAIRDLRRGEELRGSLQVLAMLVVVWLGYEAAVRKAEYRKDDRFAFYSEVQQVAGNRPLAWLGGRSSEAVWYLDREVPNLRFTARLKDGFFEIPDCVLIIREPELEAAPLLKKAVRELKRLELKGDYFRLVQADPEQPPDPKLFSGGNVSAEDDTAD